MKRAKTLHEARGFLDPRPLEFSSAGASDAQGTNKAFYIPPPPESTLPGGLNNPTPVENLRDELLSDSRSGRKMFLCGHVGSGKSTELNRLAADPDILDKFTVVPIRFEEQEWATLDSTQILFRLALAVYEFALKRELLSDNARWAERLKELDQRVVGPSGIQAREGGMAIEVDLIVLKLKQDLKLSEKTRKQFRELGETEPTFFQELLNQLVDEVEQNLARKQLPARLLLVVDDLDKVRGAEQQQEIFHTHLNKLLAPSVRVIYTIPTGVLFGEASRPEARRDVQHLFPVRVLRKSRGFNPEQACIEERLQFFHDLLQQRVEPGLIEPAAIRLAAVYSGGVLRDFFRLLRDGIRLAQFNRLDAVDSRVMQQAVSVARRSESAGLYQGHYEVLHYVHRTNELKSAADRELLDLSRVLECYNGAIWFEVNPLLWQLLEQHDDDASEG